MNNQTFWSVDNVSSFRGFDVTNGEIDLSDSEYSDYIDEIYGDAVQVGGMSYSTSRIIRELDPVAWRCGMGEYESELQDELEKQLRREDSSDIEFIEGDEFELDDEDDEE